MGLSNVQAAEFLGIPGIDDVVLNKILNAGRRPELEKLILIEEKTGVPIRAWAESSHVDGEPQGALAKTGKGR
jgi:hypothetical protein